MKRKLLAAAFIAGIALAALLVETGVAWAHHPILSGSTSCADTEHVITWTIGNSEATHEMNIVAADAVLNGTHYAVTGYTTPVADSGTTTATTTIPGDLAGNVVLSVQAHWTDGVNATKTAAVLLEETCVPETTTTTTQPPVTTTTTAPPVTTTTTAPPTTTTTQPAHHHKPTTTPTTTGGTNPPIETGTPQLPFTGAASRTLALLALLLIGFGLGILFATPDRTPR